MNGAAANRQAASPTRSEFEALMGGVLAELGRLFDPALAERLAGGVMNAFPQDIRLSIAARLARANPHWLPNMAPLDIEALAPSADLFADLAMSARLAAHTRLQPNILVACAPKSASTFIWDTLVKATGLPGAILFTSASQPTPLGANLREQELDELALILNGLNGTGYVAQHHTRMSRRLLRLMDLYRIRPVVTFRSIPDTLISLDDMLVSGRAEGLPEAHYFNDGMPRHFARMDLADRLDLLSARWTVWLTEFRTGWHAVKDHPVKPVFVSYERDLKADRAHLAARLAEELGEGLVSAEKLAACLVDESKGKAVRINKGVTGRGAAVPQEIRVRIEQVVRALAPQELHEGLLEG